ncbi:oxidoreductase-like domain-containing protein 1 [Solenopsis invicta]|uniref:oxidoreductase-like domain-containing protein 1 n=1 Tax=Solenopsis invicta TaxID=13686 RepID=UPI00193CFF41|nr:oxidoreductase-like domain-containing protein 1 [Solenopsis invicta]
MTSTLRSRLFVTKSLCYCRRNLSMQKDDEDRLEHVKESSIDDLTEPTNCCMSGCTNCVWIKYAEKLSNMMEKSNIDLQKAIFEKVQDPNMRAFLAMELRCRKLIK